MKTRDLLFRGALALGLACFMNSGAADLAGAEFSAEMLQRGPDGSTTGRMFVGDGRMRVEVSRQGRELVRITDEEEGLEWVLFPEERRFIEHAFSEQAAGALGAIESKKTPCTGMPGFECRKLDEGIVQGRPATRWEIRGSHQGQTYTSTQWIDTERGIPLIQELPNGQRTELKFIGNEEIDGRDVEKWEMVVTAPNRPETRTYQWYDPELELAIKQEFPGGVVNELRNIQVGEQPDDLFVVPEGYTRMAPPRRQGEAPGYPSR